MQQINVRLEPEQQKAVAAIAEQLRNTEQGVIRFAIDVLTRTIERNDKLSIPPRRQIARSARKPAMA